MAFSVSHRTTYGYTLSATNNETKYSTFNTANFETKPTTNQSSFFFSIISAFIYTDGSTYCISFFSTLTNSNATPKYSAV
jgi:hypothetical protein